MNDLPEGWRIAELGEVTESAVDGPFGSNLKTEHYVDEPGVRVIRLQNLGIGEFIDENRVFISAARATSLSQHQVLPGDLLVASLGDQAHPVARACQYPADGGPAIVKADCFRIRLSAGLADPGFIRHTLNCATAREGLSGLSQGVTRDRVNLASLRHLPVLLPPISEQRRIAEILDAADEAIGSTERLVAKLECAKQALLRDFLTRGMSDKGHMRGVGSGHDHFQNSEIGSIPVSWQVRRLGELVVSSKLGTTIRGARGVDDVPLVKMGNLGWGALDLHRLEYVNRRALGAEFFAMKLAPEDLLFNTRNTAELVGKTAVWDAGFEAVPDNNILRLRFNGTVRPKFLCSYMSSGEGRSRLGRLATGTTSVSAIYWRDLRRYAVPVPAIAEQITFETSLNTLEARMQSQGMSLIKLRALRVGMMNDLLTGRVRVGA